MHVYVRQAADGSPVVIFDVSFPQHLSQQLKELQNALQQHDSWANGSMTFADMSSGVNQKAKFYPSNAAVADWQAPLAVVCSSLCSIAASGSGRVMVKAPLQYSQAVVEWLTAQPQVHWVSPRAQTKASNFFATGISQSGTAATLADASYPAGASNDAGTHPLWDAGLNGENQIVGMGDTGIDWLHCTFTDSAHTGPGSGPYLTETAATGGYTYWVSTTHRKIVYYRQVDDNVDGNGHGTHCAGSAVGSLQSPGYTGWQGMAPQAKIAFQDLGSGSTGSINAPDDLANGYYQLSYSQGAKIHSDSWGTGSSAYDALAYDVDLFSYVNQDFLPVFAAGNFGYEEVDSTVTSPSVSKNCLSVGASLTASYSGTIEQEVVTTDSLTYQMTVSGSLTATSATDSIHTVMLAYFGNNLGGAVSAGTVYPLVAGVPADGCSPLSYPYALPGKVVLLSRGNCTFEYKVATAQKGGAAAAIIYNDKEDGFVKMTADSGWSGVAITMPSAFIPASTARPLLQAMLAGASLTATFSALTLPTNRWESLAYFSSVGPTLDGRYKPDMIAPGTTISPYSDDNLNSQNCALGTDRGTSMSTPVVAGAVALVRQYFVEGWYPTGAAVAADAYMPSGPLLKAVMLGGAVAMTGLTPDQDPTKNGVPLDPPPSSRQGFGRMQLGASLPLIGSSTNMQVVDKVPMAAKGNSQKYCVTGAGGPLKVTLVWHDVPAALSAASQLVNDLDLTVYANSLNGYSVLGNGVSDHLNNVEQVSWDNLDAGLVVIKVSAYSAIQYGPQLYSLVVQGSFTGQLQSTYNPAWNGATTTSCSLPVAHISSAPSVLSNSLSPTFAFTTVDPAPAGFQCKLSGTGGSTTPTSTSGAVIPLHDWTSCSTSTTSGSKTFAFTSVNGMGDGTYLFQVRATSMCPVSPLQCLHLLLTCTCAFIEYLSLPAGSFTFQAQATDLAGNVESSGATTSNSKSWTVSLPSPHAIITGGSSGSLYSSNASITFGAYPASASATYQCRLEVYTDSTSLWIVENAFTACTSPQVHTGLQAGSYRFGAVLTGQNAEYAAQSTFSIETVGPVVNITSGPASSSTGGLITFVFVSEAAAYFQCRWLNVSAGITTGSFNNCTSPAQRTDLTDGNWVFQVQALATSGVSGATVSFPFLVDSTAPIITEFIVGYTANRQAVNTSVASAGITKVPTAAFVVYMTYSDGLLGSGVSNGTYYRLQPEASSAQVATVAFKQSNPPLTLSASKGTYILNTIVADQAGNAATYNVTILSSSALSSFSKLSLYMCLWAGIAALTLSSGLW
ncbi:hypothetical protein WJX77_001610 [Trebouxia sp. C0004]